jgi:hypothetical protein
MASQTLLFTVMPRGISLDADSLPVSVYVSPRLFADAERGLLKDFPDWLMWTRNLQERGLALTFHCNGQDFTAPVAREGLQPDLWEALFKADTLVRSHTFDDYSGHGILSSSTRAALSLLKGMYQKASIELALPKPLRQSRKQQPDNYDSLKQLVGGLAVNWDGQRSYRNRYEFQSSAEAQFRSLKRQGIGQDGTIPFDRFTPETRHSIASNFIGSQKIPPGTPLADDPPDFENLLDFHQALSSLNSYPELLRALGIVLDFDLPKDFVALAKAGTPGKLSVNAALPEWEWAIRPAITPLETAYLYFATEAGQQTFLTAPQTSGAGTGNMAGNQPVEPDEEVVGLLRLRPDWFGLAQVDVDGGMHKAIMLAETVQDTRHGLADPPHPEVFDSRATLPSLRSGGFSLFADERGGKLLKKLKTAQQVNQRFDNQQPQDTPFYAEALVHGYRIDIWDSHTRHWHSLHRRHATYTLEGQTFTTADEEGFTQLAAAQPASSKDNARPPTDIYLQETIARWAGWSLSVPFPDKALSSDPDPLEATKQDKSKQNMPVTPFKMTTDFKVVGGSLPSLRFGRRYRVRARAVDICGNSIPLDAAITEQLTPNMVLPANPEGMAYLRYEPVISPQVVLRDAKGVTEPGSQLDRLVIRTFNSEPALDGSAADLTASDRHILPPRTSVEIAERLGMLDDVAGKISRSPALYSVLAAKDGAELNQVEAMVAGQAQAFPLEANERIDTLPYIPDVLARGAALRDLPGTLAHSVATVQPGVEPEAAVPYRLLDDPNPRPGSATLVSFGGAEDWQTIQPFRLALAEGNAAPAWDAANRVLTVALPKGTSAVVPLSSYLYPDDLKLMGIWQWMQEYMEAITSAPEQMPVTLPQNKDRIAHILQRTVEGGHWMLTPPHLLHLIHAVQQPLGIPAFTAISVQHEAYDESKPDRAILQTQPETAPTAETELSPITAWRRLGSTAAYLLGGLQVHGASTAKIDILAEWDDPVDDPNKPWPNSEHHAAPVDEVPIHQLNDHRIAVTPPAARAVGYYDADHDLLCFARMGDNLGNLTSGKFVGEDAAPRHQINDTKHHRISYTAIATSRYQDYFTPQGDDGNARDFTRKSQPVVVDVPASTRPFAPQIAYVIPTFGWQRQTQTNLKRSVRFGGGLRVYLERPWFSSGDGELLGVTLFTAGEDISQDQVRDRWKLFITQWGHDPIWQKSGSLRMTPSISDFPDALAQEYPLGLEEDNSKQVGVVGYPVAFDAEQQKWYCDLTVDAGSTYSPFVRLALVRYQPHALVDAKLSRVVLADFAQLTPERSVMVTADPYLPGRLRIIVSGVAPAAGQVGRNPYTQVRLQERDDTLEGDLAWRDAAPEAGTFSPIQDVSAALLYAGRLKLNVPLQAGRYRLLITETESFPADGNAMLVPRGHRLIYCESILLDDALLGEPATHSNRTIF